MEFSEVQALTRNASSWSSTKPYILWCWIKMQDLGSSWIHPTLLSYRSWWRRRAGRLRTRRKAASRGPLESSAGRRSGIGYISLVPWPSLSFLPPLGSGKVQMVTLWESEQAMHQSEEDAEQLRSATARAAGGE